MQWRLLSAHTLPNCMQQPLKEYSRYSSFGVGDTCCRCHTHAWDVRRGAGAIARNEAPPRIVPIASLNSYQNHWTIKARITQKSDIKRYSNARGEGVGSEPVQGHRAVLASRPSVTAHTTASSCRAEILYAEPHLCPNLRCIGQPE